MCVFIVSRYVLWRSLAPVCLFFTALITLSVPARVRQIALKDVALRHKASDCLDSLQHGAYELLDAGLVVGVGGFDLALGDDAANGHGTVTHVQGETGDA